MLLTLFVVATGCLLIALHLASANSFAENQNSIVDKTSVGLRRRLEANKHKKYSQEIRYLSLGGPLTYGRGLDDRLEAYPYKLTSDGRNVAYPTYESSGPTMASLCTQSIVEGTTDASVEYDVITLEYPFSLSDSTKDAYFSSMELLVQRLRQRYPQAKLILVDIWSPRDFVFFDTAFNTTVSFEEWKTVHYDSNDAPFEWTFRTLSETELQVQNQMEATMASVGGLVAKLARPEHPSTLMEDWFAEEKYHEDDETFSLRYTLSRNGHAAVAKSIREAIQNHRPTAQSHLSLHQRLFSWGSGDSCKLWYDTGTKDLPDSHDHSDGLKPTEIAPSSYALEVTKGGTLNVHNPFDTERLIYLTYLTASGLATSNKVYPKTKVKLVDGTSVILDPSHNLHHHQHHFTRTSAVGVLKGHQTNTLEFTTLEEYTVHPFRIVGVSILHTPEETMSVPFEMGMFSPRRLTHDKDIADDFDDELENYE